jgi:hypothetical protein
MISSPMAEAKKQRQMDALDLNTAFVCLDKTRPGRHPRGEQHIG